MTDATDPFAAFQSFVKGELAPSDGVNELAVETAKKTAAILLEASDRFTDNYEGDFHDSWREPIKDLHAWVQIAGHNCVTGNTMAQHSDAGCGNDDWKVKWADALRVAESFIREHPDISPDGLTQASAWLSYSEGRHTDAARTWAADEWWASWRSQVEMAGS